MTNERLKVLKVRVENEDDDVAIVATVAEELFVAVEELQAYNARLASAIVVMATGSAAGSEPMQ